MTLNGSNRRWPMRSDEIRCLLFNWKENTRTFSSASALIVDIWWRLQAFVSAKSPSLHAVKLERLNQCKWTVFVERRNVSGSFLSLTGQNRVSTKISRLRVSRAWITKTRKRLKKKKRSVLFGASLYLRNGDAWQTRGSKLFRCLSLIFFLPRSSFHPPPLPPSPP